jgi:hypothetical protein
LKPIWANSRSLNQGRVLSKQASGASFVADIEGRAARSIRSDRVKAYVASFVVGIACLWV